MRKQTFITIIVLMQIVWQCIGQSNNQVNNKEVKLGLPVGHSEGISSVSFSANGNYIVTGSWDYSAKIWEVESGKLIQNLVGHMGNINFTQFHPTKYEVLTVSTEDGTAKTWNVFENSVRLEFFKVLFAQYSPCGNYIIIYTWENELKVIDVNSNKEKFKIKISIKKDDFGIPKIDICGNKIAYITQEESVNIINIDKGKITSKIKEEEIYFDKIYLVNNGLNLITLNADGIAKRWNTENGKVIETFNSDENPYQLITIDSYGKNVYYWDYNNSLAKIGTSEIITNAEDVIKIRCNPDGKNFYFLQDNGIFSIYNGNQKINKINTDFDTPDMVFSADCATMAIFSFLNNTVSLFNTQKGLLISKLETKAQEFEHISCNKDSKIISLSSEEMVRFLDFNSGEFIPFNENLSEDFFFIKQLRNILKNELLSKIEIL